jgi:hypothetical protein
VKSCFQSLLSHSTCAATTRGGSRNNSLDLDFDSLDLDLSDDGGGDGDGGTQGVLYGQTVSDGGDGDDLEAPLLLPISSGGRRIPNI